MVLGKGAQEDEVVLGPGAQDGAVGPGLYLGLKVPGDALDLGPEVQGNAADPRQGSSDGQVPLAGNESKVMNMPSIIQAEKKTFIQYLSVLSI